MKPRRQRHITCSACDGAGYFWGYDDAVTCSCCRGSGVMTRSAKHRFDRAGDSIVRLAIRGAVDGVFIANDSNSRRRRFPKTVTGRRQGRRLNRDNAR